MAKSPSRVIMLTGVTRGLGRALAHRFAEAGHQVLGCGRSAEAIDALKSLPGGPHDFDVVDVANDDQVKNWAERLLEAFGPPDLLINNAALMNRNARLWEVPAQEMEQIVRVNILGVVNVIRHVVPAMVERGNGVIVNLSSYWGRSVAPEVAPYCATKWAIEGLTRAMAEELPATMAAVPLNPGIIDTEMLRSCFGDQAGQYLTAEKWSHAAAKMILDLGPKDNGKPLTAPWKESHT